MASSPGAGAASLRSGSAAARQRVTASAHSSGISLSTATRARTSSPRLWSCVAVVSMARGKLLARAIILSWKVSTLIEKVATSKPTSVREIRRP